MADSTRLELYAAVVADIAVGKPEEEVYAAYGLTDTTYAQLEREIEGELSRAMEAEPDASSFLVAYDRALREAHGRATQGAAPMSFADYGRAMAALTSGGDPIKALEAAKLDPAQVARATQHHVAQLAKDQELVQSFERMSRGEKKKP